MISNEYGVATAMAKADPSGLRNRAGRPDQSQDVASLGWREKSVQVGADGLVVGGQQVIQFWERPVMEAMGAVVARAAEEVLEVGFGLGLSATAITRMDCVSHTIVEAHPVVAGMARDWVAREGTRGRVRVLQGFWQDLVGGFADASFDGILFDTCPTSESERDVWYRSFFSEAARLLRPGGVFTYYSHQGGAGQLRDYQELSKLFGRMEAPIRVPVRPTGDCEYWHGSDLLVPVLYR